MTLASLIVHIRGNTIDLQQKLTQSQRDLDLFQARMASASAAMAKSGRVLTAGVTLPIVAIGTAAIRAGMDVVESENLFEVSFGNMAGAARAWSKETSDALKLNEFEMRRQSATLFVMLESMGLARGQAYDMATSMTRLSADMASFYDLPHEEAFAKIQSGISGEMEPLKRLGILLDENTVKTAAYEHGIAKQGEELTQQQKVMGRYLALMDQTSKAQGDLARTLDSPTNRLRALRSTIDETTARLGLALLPVFVDVVEILETRVVPVVERAVEWFSSLDDEGQRSVLMWVGLAAALGPVLMVLAPLVTAIGTVTPLLMGAGAAAATTGTAAAGAAGGVSLLGTAVGALGSALSFLFLTPAGLAIVALGGLAAAVWAYKSATDDTLPSVKGMGSELADIRLAEMEAAEAEREHETTLLAVELGIQDATTAAGEYTGALETMAAATQTASEREKELAENARQAASNQAAVAQLFSTTTGDIALSWEEAERVAMELTRATEQQLAQTKAISVEARKAAESYAAYVREAEDAVMLAAEQEAAFIAVGRSLETDKYDAYVQEVEEHNAALRDNVRLLEEQESALLAVAPLLQSSSASGGLLSAMTQPFTALVNEGLPTAKRGVLGFFSDILGGATGMGQSLNSIFQAAFTGGGGAVGAVKSFATQGLAALMSMIPGVGPFVSQFAGAIVAGFSKIGGWVKQLFGGPSQAELEGRESAAAFRAGILEGLSPDQMAEVKEAARGAWAGNEEGAALVITLRDAYFEMGHTAVEADRMAQEAADRLWRAEKEGAGAVDRVVADLNADLERHRAILEENEHTAAAALAAEESAVRAVNAALEETNRILAEKAAMAARERAIYRGNNAGGSSGGTGIEDVLDRYPGLQDEPALAQRVSEWAQEQGGDLHRAEEAFGMQFARGTPGLGFMNFGRGTRASLHGDEAVVPRARAADFAAQHSPEVVSEIRGLRSDLRALPRLMRDAVLLAGTA